MIIVDTSIWIEFLKQSNPDIDNMVSAALDNNQLVGISVVFGELLQGVRNQQEEKVVLELWDNLPKLNETNLFLEAGILSHRHKLLAKGVGLIDCYILAASRKFGYEIISLDKKLLKAYENLS